MYIQATKKGTTATQWGNEITKKGIMATKRGKVATKLGTIQNKPKKREIIKSNNLIESSYKFTIAEQRLVYLASTKLNKLMIDSNLSIEEVQKLIKNRCFELIEISVNEYKKDFTIKSNNIYEELAQAANRLFERKIIYEKDGGTIGQKRWVITCEYNEDKKSVFLQFHPDLMYDLLIFKSNYTIFHLDATKGIKGNYAGRIYELLKRYERFKYRTFDLEELRFKLGIKDEEYPRYSNLKQKVILPAIKQINEFTDLYCELVEKKDRGKVSEIAFKFIPQKVADNIGQQLSFIDNEIAVTSVEDKINMVKKFSDIIGVTVTAGQLDKIITISLEVIEREKLNIEVIDYIREKKVILDNYSKKHEVKSYLGALIVALQNNWTLNKKPDTFNDYEQRQYSDEWYDNLEKTHMGLT